MTQFGFFYDQSRCTGCHACSIICKSGNSLPPGPAKWMRVFKWETGTVLDLRVHALAVPCYHCENAPCLQACPADAIYKEEDFGAVLVRREKCEDLHRTTHCRRCWQACPYGAPQFESDDPRATMSKCTMCVDRLRQGKRPVCVLGCSLRALDFDTLGNLRDWYGPGQTPEGLPDRGGLKPSVVFRLSQPKRQLVPWDASEALTLWQGRGAYASPGLPPVFESLAGATELAPRLVRRDRLVLKPATAQEMMYYTSDDE